MMKRSFFFFYLMIATLICARVTFAKNPVLPASPTSINVKDFGAKGDGATDDTDAIQRAVNAQVAQYAKWGMRVEHWGHLTKGAIENPCAEIVFPAGTYRISRPIVFSRFAYVRGIGIAVIAQTSNDQDCFYFNGVQQATVDNLQFKGGKKQLHFWTDNIGIATIDVSHCVFTDSSDYAIECTSYTKVLLDGEAWGNTKPWAPYGVKWTDGLPQLTANSPDNLTPWANSTMANIAHCRFENVMHAINLTGDTEVIRDCEITTNPQMEGGAFRLGGLVYLYNIKGTARLNPAKRQYWIDDTPYIFYTSIALRDCNLTTDSSRGMSLIHSSLLPNGTSIIVDNCRVKSAGSAEGALVWIEKGTEPNIISVTGTTDISGKPVKAVAWEEIPGSELLDKIKDQPKFAKTEDIYKLQIAGNSNNIDAAVPEIFQPLLQQPIPATAIEQTFVPELSWDYSDLKNAALQSGEVLFAADFGLKQNSSTDATAIIQKIFDAAARQKNCLVIFPAGTFHISDAIHLPPRVVVRAAGTAAIVQDNPGKELFTASHAKNIAFRDIRFIGGLNGLHATNDDTHPARISLHNCYFYDQTDNAILAMAGKGETGEANQMELRLHGGILASLHGVTTNAARSQLDLFTAVNDPHLDNDSFIKNLGGEMRINSMLSNPKLWQGKRGKAPDNITDWQFSKQTCWVENWGKYYSVDTRYGGESGGMCNVVNRVADGTIFISGGNTRFYNGLTRKTILYLEKIPRFAILENITTPAAKIEDSFAVMNADGSDGKHQANIIVRGVPAP